MTKRKEEIFFLLRPLLAQFWNNIKIDTKKSHKIMAFKPLEHVSQT